MKGKKPSAASKSSTNENKTMKSADENINNLLQTIEEKNNKIIELENFNKRITINNDNLKEIVNIDKKNKPKPSTGGRTGESSSGKEEGSRGLQPFGAKICKWENIRKCKHGAKCRFFHPTTKCQSHSIKGSCENIKCQHRHPEDTCFEWKDSGRCKRGDNCRFRHPSTKSNKSFLGSRRDQQSPWNQEQMNLLYMQRMKEFQEQQMTQHLLQQQQYLQD